MSLALGAGPLYEDLLNIAPSMQYRLAGSSRDMKLLVSQTTEYDTSNCAGINVSTLNVIYSTGTSDTPYLG